MADIGQQQTEENAAGQTADSVKIAVDRIPGEIPQSLIPVIRGIESQQDPRLNR